MDLEGLTDLSHGLWLLIHAYESRRWQCAMQEQKQECESTSRVTDCNTGNEVDLRFHVLPRTACNNTLQQMQIDLPQKLVDVRMSPGHQESNQAHSRSMRLFVYWPLPTFLYTSEIKKQVGINQISCAHDLSQRAD